MPLEEEITVNMPSQLDKGSAWAQVPSITQLTGVSLDGPLVTSGGHIPPNTADLPQMSPHVDTPQNDIRPIERQFQETGLGFHLSCSE